MSILRPAVFDRDILVLDIAGFDQALMISGQQWHGRVARSAAEVTNDRHRGALCASTERPDNRRAADCGYKIAASHSITSSARARIDGGIASPSALAVLRLTISSNLVGCSIGKSPGFAPLRILS